MQLSKDRKLKGLYASNVLKDEETELVEENLSLKQKIGIMKGRECMRRVMANPDDDVIADLPLEYVQYCTKNFASHRRLSQRGSGDVFVAVDEEVDPKIQYVAKRVQLDNLQPQKSDLFRRELEVNQANTFD